jgi:N-acetylmuramoyl-L-alanine amidase
VQRLAAFRLRFRPGATGAADATDAGLAADLAERFPVDRWDLRA